MADTEPATLDSLAVAKLLAHAADECERRDINPRRDPERWGNLVLSVFAEGGYPIARRILSVRFLNEDDMQVTLGASCPKCKVRFHAGDEVADVPARSAPILYAHLVDDTTVTAIHTECL